MAIRIPGISLNRLPKTSHPVRIRTDTPCQSCYLLVVAATLYQPFPIAGAARGQIWRHQPSTRRPRHFHAEPELNLVTAGRVAFGFGAQAVEVAAGDLLCWTPGQDHELLSASDDFDLFVVGLTPDFSERVLGANASAPQRGPVLLRLASEQLASLAPPCLFPALHGDAVVKERAVGDLWQLAHSFRDIRTVGHTLTRRSLSFVNDRPEISRDEIARRSHASPGEISRHFHRDMGLTFSAYRARVRLLRFIALVDGGSTLLQAALAAGFGSYSQCHRVFQATLGCAPRVFFASPVRRTIEDSFAPLASVKGLDVPAVTSRVQRVEQAMVTVVPLMVSGNLMYREFAATAGGASARFPAPVATLAAQTRDSARADRTAADRATCTERAASRRPAATAGRGRCL